ncbi:MAG: hypothetical protein HOM25_15470 [Rhodospirillaceae bacterium]|nr:hypothetical protein [Rhodospirillaceae bacterium]MBT5667059.1 hypothetical protein [Rhodospirillaceae bacterium]
MSEHDETCREMSPGDAKSVKCAYDNQISAGHTSDTALNLATTVYLQLHPFEPVEAARQIVLTCCDRTP